MWMMNRMLARMSRCTCGAVKEALAWTEAPTVRRYERILYREDIREAWLTSSPIAPDPAANEAALARWRKRQRRRNPWPAHPALRAHLLDGATCTYCPAPATELDHVVPRCQGGGHERSNLVPACHTCNVQKAGRTPEQWRAGERPGRRAS